jgi:hypothetical protein
MPLEEPYTKTDTIVMPPTEQNMKPFGEVVYESFEGARFDAEEMAHCLVAGAWTAGVFHMMRAVEWGVRAFGKELGMSRVKEIQRPQLGGLIKTRKVHFTPLENCVWEKIQDQLRIRVDRRLAKLRPGPSKDRKQVFYSSVLSDFHGFKGEWRNHVMHARMEYTEDDACKAFEHVKRFMMELARAGQAR